MLTTSPARAARTSSASDDVHGAPDRVRINEDAPAPTKVRYGAFTGRAAHHDPLSLPRRPRPCFGAALVLSADRTSDTPSDRTAPIHARQRRRDEAQSGQAACAFAWKHEGRRHRRRFSDPPARSRIAAVWSRLGLCHPVSRPRAPKGQRCQGSPPEGQAPQGEPRRSSGRADLISGKPRRRKATAPHRSLPQDQPPRRGRRVGQPSFLGGTRRYLPAHLRAPQPTHGSAPVRGRAQGGADAGRLPTATASQDQSATSSDTATSGAGGRATASGNDQTFPTCTSLRASPQLTRSGFRGWPGCGAPEPNVASTA